MVCILQVDFTKALIRNSGRVDSSVIKTEASMRSAPSGLFDGQINPFAEFS